MKILALADRRIHEDLISLINKEKIELVILLGDLKFIDIEELKDSPVPVIGVYGNHCQSDYLEEGLNAFNCHLQEFKHQGYSFLGFEGCPFYKGNEREYTQSQCDTLLQSALGVDIFISHSPAQGINSSQQSPHEGFKAIREYLEKYQPKYYFHGHSYPPKELAKSKFNHTIVVYVSGWEVIDLSKLEIDSLPNSQGY